MAHQFIQISNLIIILAIVSLSLLWIFSTGTAIKYIVGFKSRSSLFLGTSASAAITVVISYFGSGKISLFMLPALIFFTLLQTKHLSAKEDRSLPVLRTLKSGFVENRYSILSVTLFSTLQTIFFLTVAPKQTPGIISLGNPDPINYGLIARQIELHGFFSSNDFPNADLGKQGSWDWTATQSFYAFLRSIISLFQFEYVFAPIAFTVLLSAIGFLGYSRLALYFFDDQKFVSRISVYALVGIIQFSQLGQYVVGNGFYAQLAFVYLFPHLILHLIENVPGANNLSNRLISERVRDFLTASLVGFYFCFYAPLGWIAFPFLLLLILKTFITRVKANGYRDTFVLFSNYKTYLIGFLFGFLFLIPYLRTANSRIVLGASAMPGWPIPNFDLSAIIPFSVFCLPGESIDNCNGHTNNAEVRYLFLFALFALTFYGLLSSKRVTQVRKSAITKLFFAYSSIVAMYPLAKYGLEAYPTWKFLSSMQELLMVVFVVPYLTRGIASLLTLKRKSRLKLSLKYLTLFTLFSSLLFQANSASELWSRSGYTYTSPHWLTNSKKWEKPLVNDLGINIELGGFNGMLAALFISVEKRVITRSSGYFSYPSNLYPFTLTDSPGNRPKVLNVYPPGNVYIVREILDK